MMTVRALIFDVGGVLLHLPNHLRRREWESSFGLPDGAIAQALWGSELARKALIGQVHSDEVWRSLTTTLALTSEQLDHIRQNYFVGEYLDSTMEQLLQQLRPHYTLALLTNAWSDARSVLTAKFLLESLVHEIIISAEVGLAKPDPAIYILTLERLQVEPSEALFIDDKQRNVKAAQALGITSILFQSPPQAIAEIEQYLSRK